MNIHLIPRILKIYALIIPRPAVSEKVPQIKLQGKWLKDAGFKPGQNIKVSLLNGGLFIAPFATEGPRHD